MKVLLVGGPLDGQRVEVSDSQANFISSQNADTYVRAMPSVFISAKIPQEEMVAVLAQKLIDGYDLSHRVGMAVTQLDDATMYTGGGRDHALTAREILSHE